jgi:hypothetical protein
MAVRYVESGQGEFQVFFLTAKRILVRSLLCGGRVGHVVGFDFAPLTGRRNDEAEAFEPRQAFDHGRARKFGALHEESQADGHAAIGNSPAGLDDGQIDFDSLAGDPGQVSAVEKNRFYPVVMSGFRPGDWHDSGNLFQRSHRRRSRSWAVWPHYSGCLARIPTAFFAEVFFWVWLLANASPPGRCSPRSEKSNDTAPLSATASFNSIAKRRPKAV